MSTSRLLVICALLFGSFAHADRAGGKKLPSIVARVVGMEIMQDAVVVTVATGTDMGIHKKARARFREGTTNKLLAGGESVVIRVDKRTAILKTKLSPAQIRANKFIQFDQ